MPGSLEAPLAKALKSMIRPDTGEIEREIQERIADAYAAMDQRRAIKSLVRVGSI